ncbi:MAG: WD40 repeat domain-containing protein [Anaerolineae bacterium]|nr:WD40 repeat domain-containing protein [Anaerolineae bacterium]
MPEQQRTSGAMRDVLLIIVLLLGLIGSGWGVLTYFQTTLSSANLASESFALSPAPKGVISADTLHQVTSLAQWSKDPTGKTAEQADQGINSLAFSPDGITLLSGSATGVAQVWQISGCGGLAKECATLLDTLPGEVEVDSVAFSPDGTTVAIAVSRVLTPGVWDDTVRVWRRADGVLLHRLEGPRVAVISCGLFRNSVVFSPDGSLLASGSYDHAARLWRASDGTLLHSFEGHAGAVLSLAFSPDGAVLATASDDGTVKLWKVSTGELWQTFPGYLGAATSVAFSPDGTFVASGEATGMVRLWQVTDGKMLHTFEGQKNTVSNLDFSPDGTLLAAGSSTADNSVNLWRVADGVLLRTLKGHTARLNSVVFSPDGTLLASAAEDGVVRLWGLADPLNQ